MASIASCTELRIDALEGNHLHALTAPAACFSISATSFSMFLNIGSLDRTQSILERSSTANGQRVGLGPAVGIGAALVAGISAELSKAEARESAKLQAARIGAGVVAVDRLDDLGDLPTHWHT